MHPNGCTDKGRKIDPAEMYDHGRYYTVTGVAANGCPATVNERGTLLAAFLELLENQNNL